MTAPAVGHVLDGKIICGKHVNKPCPNKAVELLLILPHGGYGWEVKPRCLEHPAAADLPLIGRVAPGTPYAIVPLARAKGGVS